MAHEIPQPFSEMQVDCPECVAFNRKNQTTPDIIMGHLIETHGYTTGQANDWLQSWMNGFPQDNEGWPLETCASHGYYKIPGPCYGCEAEEPRDD